MTDKDAAIGRKVMVDELETISQYEAMANHASPDVAKIVRDIADEEKVHVGEAAAIVDRHDKRARPAMEEGVKEAKVIMKSFNEMLTEAIAKSDAGKGYPPMTEAQMMRDPYRHVQMQVNDQVNMNANDGEKISSEGSMKEADKNDGESGAYDEDNAPAKKEVKDDGVSGAFDKKAGAGPVGGLNAVNGEDVVGGTFEKTNGTGVMNARREAAKSPNVGTYDKIMTSHDVNNHGVNKKEMMRQEPVDTETDLASPSEQIDYSIPDSTKKSLPSFADMYSHGVGYAFEKNCKRNLVEEMRKEYKEKKEKGEDAPEKTEKEESSDERVYFDDPDVDL